MSQVTFAKNIQGLRADYFRIRDFEYAQPLYDLAFLLEVEALSSKQSAPKYRIHSLWKAAYKIDGYTATIDRWLDGKIASSELDYVPSGRIRQYLEEIRSNGNLAESLKLSSTTHRKILSLRAIRGLGAAGIAKMMRENPSEFADGVVWPASDGDITSKALSMDYPWQSAHVVPPLLRFLRQIEVTTSKDIRATIEGISDGIQPVSCPFTVTVNLVKDGGLSEVLSGFLQKQPFFRKISASTDTCVLEHIQGWTFNLESNAILAKGSSVLKLAQRLDPLTRSRSALIKGDLHLHSTWSDGNSEVIKTAEVLKEAGYEYLALTDHSRSCKLQGGLTPIDWIRQSISLNFQKIPFSILHGIEVDILPDGCLDLPAGLLSGVDLVIGSVHSSWSKEQDLNTERLFKAIESGLVDILGHPTSAIVGKPGVPNYNRPAAKVDWRRVFKKCAEWRVALELNCFPSRLDLAFPALEEAVSLGCWISLGSDAHSRTHLQHMRFGEAIVSKLSTDKILNSLSFLQLRSWINEARSYRKTLPVPKHELFSDVKTKDRKRNDIKAVVNTVQSLPSGGSVIGIDLTAGKGKPTGLAVLDGFRVTTLSLVSDDDIVLFVGQTKPAMVSIDSPLGLPGGKTEIDPNAGIVRVAERDLASVGVPAYPALIDSMKELTLRGIRIKQRIEKLPHPPKVIESYPGAAQDILCIPRKQEGLDLLRQGLRELGLNGPGLDTSSHDEMDAITSAIVGRYYEKGEFEPMGVPAEAQLIVPKTQPLIFHTPPIICLAGRTGAGKSVVARYLAVYYGFHWIRTRDVIRSLMVEDAQKPESSRLYPRKIDPSDIAEQDLVDFGAMILNKFGQEPLVVRLNVLVSESQGPVVVDAIRDLHDVGGQSGHARPLFIWFIDASESVMRQRVLHRSLFSQKALAATSAVESHLVSIRVNADSVLINNGTLEELRWDIDDLLCSLIKVEMNPSFGQSGFHVSAKTPSGAHQRLG